MSSAQPSNKRRTRRNEEMKFAYSGPFVRLLGKAPKVPVARTENGNVLDPQPKYAPTSAENYTIGAAIPEGTKFLLQFKPSRNRRRGGRS